MSKETPLSTIAPCKKKWVELGYSKCPDSETKLKANKIYLLLRDGYNVRPRRTFHDIDGGIYLHYKNRTNQYTLEIQVNGKGTIKAIINDNFKAKELSTYFISGSKEDFESVISDFKRLSSNTKGENI